MTGARSRDSLEQSQCSWQNFGARARAPNRASSTCLSERMFTPKRRDSRIAFAVIVCAPTETRRSGGVAETEQQALTVSPQGFPSNQVVTITTELAILRIASQNASVRPKLEPCI